MTSWLQNAGRLRHAVADLARPGLRSRAGWQVVGACCGQVRGQLQLPAGLDLPAALPAAGPLALDHQQASGARRPMAEKCRPRDLRGRLGRCGGRESRALALRAVPRIWRRAVARGQSGSSERSLASGR
jgi:hypothetical protein